MLTLIYSEAPHK